MKYYLILLLLLSACSGSKYFSKCCVTDSAGRSIDTTRVRWNTGDVVSVKDKSRKPIKDVYKISDTVVIIYADSKIKSDTVILKP